ncbi:MAG: hypothetical protein ACREEP_13090 [Dongiaceae bacterium]
MKLQKPLRVTLPLTEDRLVDVNALIRAAWETRGLLQRGLYVVSHGRPSREESLMKLGALETALEPFTEIAETMEPAE